MKSVILALAVISGLTATEAAASNEAISGYFQTEEECKNNLSLAQAKDKSCSDFKCYSEVGKYRWGASCSETAASTPEGCHYNGARCAAISYAGYCIVHETLLCPYPPDCKSGYYVKQIQIPVSSTETYVANICEPCPDNATCDGTSTITCDSGYTESDGECVIKKAFNDNDVLFACIAGYTDVNGECVKDGAANTVNSCPPEMTLSADGCCCLN